MFCVSKNISCLYFLRAWPATPRKVLKKLLFLILIIAILLAVDGALTYDIFDYRVDSLPKLLAVLILIFIFAGIAWADSSKKHEDKNTSE